MLPLGTHRTTDDANRLRLDGSDILGTTKGPGLGIEMLHSVAEKDTDISVRNKVQGANSAIVLAPHKLEDLSSLLRTHAHCGGTSLQCSAGGRERSESLGLLHQPK